MNEKADREHDWHVHLSSWKFPRTREIHAEVRLALCLSRIDSYLSYDCDSVTYVASVTGFPRVVLFGERLGKKVATAE